MKIISLSDWHIMASTPLNRTDDFIETQFRKINYLIDRANEIGAVVVVPGDLLDRPTIPYWLFNRLVDTLGQLEREMYVIPGNHDTKGHNLEALDEGALPALARTGVINVPTKASWANHGGVVHLHLVPFGLEPQPPRHARGVVNILVAHIPVFESNVPFYMEDGITVKALETKYPGFDLYLVGDIHIPAVRSKTVISGSMTRIKINQREERPRFYEIDTDDLSVVAHYFPIEEDVWRTVTLESETASAFEGELKELADAMLARDERMDYPAVCKGLAAGNVVYEQRIQSIIDDYKESMK